MPDTALIAESDLFRAAVARVLRDARAEAGMSQADVARAAGITQASVSNYEHGKRDVGLYQFLRLISGMDRSHVDLMVRLRAAYEDIEREAAA